MLTTTSRKSMRRSIAWLAASLSLAVLLILGFVWRRGFRCERAEIPAEEGVIQTVCYEWFKPHVVTYELGKVTSWVVAGPQGLSRPDRFYHDLLGSGRISEVDTVDYRNPSAFGLESKVSLRDDGRLNLVVVFSATSVQRAILIEDCKTWTNVTAQLGARRVNYEECKEVATARPLTREGALTLLEPFTAPACYLADLRDWLKHAGADDGRRGFF
jgi:hypothetical protein